MLWQARPQVPVHTCTLLLMSVGSNSQCKTCTAIQDFLQLLTLLTLQLLLHSLTHENTLLCAQPQGGQKNGDTTGTRLGPVPFDVPCVVLVE